jgi:hypothetical protein
LPAHAENREAEGSKYSSFALSQLEKKRSRSDDSDSELLFRSSEVTDIVRDCTPGGREEFNMYTRPILLLGLFASACLVGWGCERPPQVNGSRDPDLPRGEVDAMHPALEWEFGPAAEPFVELVDVAVGEDGRVYAFDAGAASVIRLHPVTGREKRFGRQGQGPGEFRSTHRVLLAGGEVVLPDLGNRRLVRFDLDGEFTGVTPIPDGLGLPTEWAAPGGERVIGRFRSVDIPVVRDLGGRTDGDVLVSLDVRTGAAEELLPLPRGSVLSGGSEPRIRLLAPEPLWHVSRGGWTAVGLNDGYQVTLHDPEAGSATIIGRDLPRQPVSDDDKRRLVDLLGADMLRRGAPPERLAPLASMVEVADWYPVITRVMFGPSSSVLVQLSRGLDEVADEAAADFRGFDLRGIGSSRWDVYGIDGEFRGQVEFPSGFLPTDYDEQLVYGVFVAADGNQAVRAYRLVLDEGG